MTKKQIKFLECIYEGSKSAEELCKELKIRGNDNDELAGYYNALNKAIDYLVSDDGNLIDNKFKINPDKTPYSNRDRYEITEMGRLYIEKHWENKKWIIGIIIAVASIVVSIVLYII